jgi:hypothetical protein
MITLDLSILNQKGTPMFYSDLTANRPGAGIAGRIFIATDSPFGIFRDTGTAWDQVAGSGGGGGNTIYTANDTLTSNRVVSSGGFGLSFTSTTHIGTATIGGGGSGQLIVGSSNADNGIQIFGANSPSLRIDNAQSGGSQRFVIGLSTATNNFIQGSTAGQFCISNASSGAILFGMWQTINATEVFRITTANNLLVGLTIDAGFKVDVGGNARINGVVVGRGNSSSDQNTCVGRDSGIGAMTGIQNTTLGFRAGRFITSGSYNTCIGVQANPNGNIGDFNVCVGYSTANSLANGSNNTLLGSYAGNSNNGNSTIMLGNFAGFNQTGVSNTLFIDNRLRSSAAAELTDSMIYGVSSTNLSNQILRLNARTGVGLSADPVASAQFQIDSITRGFLPPRMTNAEILAISSPAEGLIVYNTTISNLCCYQAGAWSKFSHSPM